jgi:MYXO-CTERM domain-containing protein
VQTVIARRIREPVRTGRQQHRRFGPAGKDGWPTNCSVSAVGAGTSDHGAALIALAAVLPFVMRRRRRKGAVIGLV